MDLRHHYNVSFHSKEITQIYGQKCNVMYDSNTPLTFSIKSIVFILGGMSVE